MSAVDFESIAREAVAEKRRLCIDCRHHWARRFNTPLCARNTSPVDGKPHLSCEWERALGKCGPGGKGWEPR